MHRVSPRLTGDGDDAQSVHMGVHDQRVFKIAPAAEWASAGALYEGSPLDRRDGFIHLSAADQVVGTRARYFSSGDDLVLIEIDAGALGPSLKWEPSRAGALYPHLYGPLPRAAIVSVRALP